MFTNCTKFCDGVELKFVPVIVTTVPAGPAVGVKPVIVGSTKKLAGAVVAV